MSLRPIEPRKPTEVTPGLSLALFGSEAWPIRISSLYALQKCNGFFIWRTIAEKVGMSPADLALGEPADTGSAVGRGAELWHATQLDLGAILDTLAGEAPANFPMADLGRAGRILARYTADSRNPRDAVLAGSCELTVTVTAPMPYGPPLHLVGHIDQIRIDRVNGALSLWDIKCSRKPGAQLMADYAWQLAMYSLGCTRHYGRPVTPGGILAVASYDMKQYQSAPDNAVPIFYPFPWGLDQCESWLDHICTLVDQIRRGVFHTRPGDACAYCPRALPACELELLDGARNGAFRP